MDGEGNVNVLVGITGYRSSQQKASSLQQLVVRAVDLSNLATQTALHSMLATTRCMLQMEITTFKF